MLPQPARQEIVLQNKAQDKAMRFVCLLLLCCLKDVEFAPLAMSVTHTARQTPQTKHWASGVRAVPH